MRSSKYIESNVYLKVGRFRTQKLENTKIKAPKNISMKRERK